MNPYVRVQVPPDDPENPDIWAEPVQEYDLLSKFSNTCLQKDRNSLKEIRRMNKFFLKKYCIDFIEFGKRKNLTGDDWKRFRQDGIDKILRKMYVEYENNDKEAFFLVSALFETDKLEAIRDRHVNKMKFSKQIRNGGSAIIFCMKYGNVEHANFLETMRILLEDFEIDADKFDENGKTALDFVAESCKNHQSNGAVSENLLALARMLIDKGIYDILGDETKAFLRENRIDFAPKLFPMNLEDQLFYWICTNSWEDFCDFAMDKATANVSNGESTLLQFAVQKDSIKITQFLLEKNADPNKTTIYEKRTPLELSIANNSKRIFTELLKNSKTKMTAPQFDDVTTHILVHQQIPLKIEMFQLLLEWERLEVNLVHDKTGNTPLHFAAIFANREAVQGLLKRGASLLVENKSGKAVIDIIDFDNLKVFFDSCIILKTAKTAISDVFFKVELNFFRSLVDRNRLDELYIISKLSEKKNLRNLLKHPLVYTFISLKWTKTKYFFWIILLVQLLLLLSLTTCFCLRPIGAFFVGCINTCVKFLIFSKLSQAPIHACLEAFLIIVHFSGLFIEQMQAFLPLLISICFLITAGYHPILSKWSIMVQTVFRTFGLLLIFVSVILLSFGLGFFVLFSSDGGKEEKFRNISTSLFKAYIMSAGELSIDDIDFDTSGFFGYLILVIFTLCVPLVIVNFWTAVAVTDVEKTEREAEINAIHNVALFIKFVDGVYEAVRWQHCKKLLVLDFPATILKLKEKCRECASFVGCAITKCKNCVLQCSLCKFLTQKPYLLLSETGVKKFYDTKDCKVVSYIDNKEESAGVNKQENVIEINEDCLNKIKFYFIDQKEKLQ